MERERCCVPGCGSIINGNKKCYFFPCLTKWLPIFRKKFGIPDWNLEKDSQICQRHFNTKYMRWFKEKSCSLTYNAVPTLFLEPVVVKKKFHIEDYINKGKNRSDPNVRQSFNELSTSSGVSGISEFCPKVKLEEPLDSKEKGLDSTGPSRLDPELIKDELSNVFLPLSGLAKLCYGTTKNGNQMQSNQKNKIIDKRKGSLLLNETQIKKEKLDEEVTVDKEVVFVKTEIVENEDYSTGPSRLDPELIKDELSNVFLPLSGLAKLCYGTTKNGNQMQSNQKNKIIDKRKGSLLLNETQIKKEKLDEEVTVDKEVVFVKTEIVENEDYSLLQKEEFDLDSNKMSIGKRHHCENVLIKECLLCHLLVKGPVIDHVNTYHRNGMNFNCPFCYQSKRCSLCSYHNEIKAHRDLLIISCQFCEDKFNSWVTLDEHIFDKHEGMVPKACEICGSKDFVKGTSYHKFICHDGETVILKCDHCNFSTMNSSLLQKHVEIQHSSKNKEERKKEPKKKIIKRKCDLCDYYTKSINSFVTHMRVDHPESFH